MEISGPMGEILGALHRARMSFGKRLGLGREGRRGDPDAAQYSIAECGQQGRPRRGRSRRTCTHRIQVDSVSVRVRPSRAAKCRDISPPFPLLLMLNPLLLLLATPPS